MKKQTTLEAVKERMAEMLAKKAADLEAIDSKIEETRAKVMEAADEMQQAAAIMDTAKYEAAAAEMNRQRQAIEMYNARRAQLAKNEMVTEAESDVTIDSLLKYERELAASFKADTAEPIEKLKGILEAYRAEVADTERTIKRWTSNIHENYRPGGRGRRSDRPQPVHPLPYTGSDEAQQLGQYLAGLDGLASRKKIKIKI